jgi:hypothetical protein
MQAAYLTPASSFPSRDEMAPVVVVCAVPTCATFAPDEPPPQPAATTARPAVIATSKTTR